jgi:hypothetical protein
MLYIAQVPTLGHPLKESLLLCKHCLELTHQPHYTLGIQTPDCSCMILDHVEPDKTHLHIIVIDLGQDFSPVITEHNFLMSPETPDKTTLKRTHILTTRSLIPCIAVWQDLLEHILKTS